MTLITSSTMGFTITIGRYFKPITKIARQFDTRTMDRGRYENKISAF